MITKELVQHLFDYRDGQLYWRVRPSTSVRIGAITGSVNSTGYRQTRINKKIYLNHRIIFLWHYGWLPKNVDHKDKNPLNNKIDNLRAATESENSWNAKVRVDNTSGIKGVYKTKSENKWRVQVQVNNKRKNIGGFDDLELAELVAIMAREKYHGAFANHG
jgi:hypothetical protein